MKLSVWGVKLCMWILICFAVACGSSDIPLKTQDPSDDQPALDTENRREPDQEWESGIAARDISWHYNYYTRLDRSISVVGTFKITFVNRNPNQDVAVNVLVRFIGADGFQHIPLTPFNRIAIDAGDTTRASDNFIVEVKDQLTANEMSRMSIVIY